MINCKFFLSPENHSAERPGLSRRLVAGQLDAFTRLSCLPAPPEGTECNTKILTEGGGGIRLLIYPFKASGSLCTT
jgi:hypothetical protein